MFYLPEDAQYWLEIEQERLDSAENSTEWISKPHDYDSLPLKEKEKLQRQELNRLFALTKQFKKETLASQKQIHKMNSKNSFEEGRD